MYTHDLKVVEGKTCYNEVRIDGEICSYVKQIKIEREINPMKEDELNKVLIKYNEFPNGIGTAPVEKEMVLENVKLEFIQEE